MCVSREFPGVFPGSSPEKRITFLSPGKQTMHCIKLELHENATLAVRTEHEKLRDRTRKIENTTLPE